MIWSCDTCYNPIFLWRMRWKYFYLDLASPGWPRTLRRTSWWSTARETYVSIMDMWYMLLPYFFMVNTMEMFLFWFGVTRMALYTEKDILVKYNKRKLCLHYDCVIHVITVFFYGKYDGNISILIFHHQDGLECREGHLDTQLELVWIYFVYKFQN